MRRHCQFLSGSNALANAMPDGFRKQLRWAGSYTCRWRGSKTFRELCPRFCASVTVASIIKVIWPTSRLPST